MPIIILTSTSEKVSSTADRNVSNSLQLLTNFIKPCTYTAMCKLFIKILFPNLAPSMVNMASH
jgi:hypothetical protein